MDIEASAVDGLETGHDKLFFESPVHIAGADDSERLCLSNTVAQRAWCGVHSIIVTVIGNNIDLPSLSTDGLTAEPESTVRKALPVVFPVRITSPAIVDRISRSTVALENWYSGVVADPSLCLLIAAHKLICYPWLHVNYLLGALDIEIHHEVWESMRGHI